MRRARTERRWIIPHIENDIEAFCHDPEGHYFDRKSARKDADEIAKHLMAFANAAGGKLVVGIEDDGTVTGFKRDRPTASKVSSRLCNRASSVTEGEDRAYARRERKGR